MITWLSLLYLAALIGMAVYGLLGLVTLLFYWRYRHKAYPAPAVADDHLPSVTVQLPIYNERLVLPREQHGDVKLARRPGGEISGKAEADSLTAGSAFARSRERFGKVERAIARNDGERDRP